MFLFFLPKLMNLLLFFFPPDASYFWGLGKVLWGRNQPEVVGAGVEARAPVQRSCLPHSHREHWEVEGKDIYPPLSRPFRSLSE